MNQDILDLQIAVARIVATMYGKGYITSVTFNSDGTVVIVSPRETVVYRLIRNGEWEKV